MKRTNVVVDPDLLEEARRVTGEKTYSATITTALERIVRRQRLENAISNIQAGGDPFNRDYVARMWPELAEPAKRGRVAADERRAPRKAKGITRRAR